MTLSLERWKQIGLAAAVVIVLALPIYTLKENLLSGPGEEQAPLPEFVGSRQCRSCHKPEYDKWENSHHRWAMAVASDTTVLGDFDDAEFTAFGVTSRFYKRDGKFYVTTQGPGGGMGEFEITYTFGWFPLQQYLVPFPGGRLQCLPIAWDVRKQRWYHLYPDEPLDPDDWLYWTRNGQNWNGMCAECHSTDLRKNYDYLADTYQTRWSEISVGCEACHGPGSAHVAWAELPEMGRPPIENTGLVMRTRGLTSAELIDLCAPCHSRRMSLGDNPHTNMQFLDYAIPQPLNEGLYFPDGQILDEVYVYGSFMQSKMYERGVRCSDCHDVHSIRRIKEGNDLCLQCHKADTYDTKGHHFHKKKGEPGNPIRGARGEVLFEVGSGASCEQCHMPGRYYMGVDYRPDHSFRIPRPDLTIDIGVPNACNRCHADKSAQWSLDAMTRWYGQKKRPHYGTIFAAARERKPGVTGELVRLVNDRLYPPIVRATALLLLAEYPGSQTTAIFEQSLSDESPLVRYTAVRNLPVSEPHRRLQILGPLLYDSTKAVRIEAASGLAAISPAGIPTGLQDKYQEAIADYRRAMERTADFATSRHNLGNLFLNTGRPDLAIEQYRKSVEIDQLFFPAKVNLAMALNRKGENAEAERLLRDVLRNHPDFYDVQYSLALLLVEMGRPREAIPYFEGAIRGLPSRARIQYNFGLLLQQLGDDSRAEDMLLRATRLEPSNMDFLYALTVFYLQRQRTVDAKRFLDRMAAIDPNHPAVQRLMRGDG